MLGGIVGLMLLGGCGGGGQLAPWRVELASLPYPKDAPRGQDLDIVVETVGSSLLLTNRTPLIYRDVQLWINQQYVTRIEMIDIGDNPMLPLDQLINEHGESFPTAGFLAPDRAGEVVLAEVFLPEVGVRYRLTVRRGVPWLWQ